MKIKLLCLLTASLLAACVQVPENVTPVSDFQLERYLGTWYEIARLDHSFERGLSQVTAQYSVREDGGVKVLNRGYSEKDQAWDDAEGKAYFVQDSNIGFLKVSFFGPFYGSYIVTELDKDAYRYALISGPDYSYLWILSRTPQLDSATLQRLISKAETLGFDTSKLIMVKQD